LPERGSSYLYFADHSWRRLRGLKLAPRLAPDRPAADLASSSQTMTGADIAYLCQRAAMLCVKDSVGAGEPNDAAELASGAQGLAGADIAYLCQRTAMFCVKDSVGAGEVNEGSIGKGGATGGTVADGGIGAKLFGGDRTTGFVDHRAGPRPDCTAHGLAHGHLKGGAEASDSIRTARGFTKGSPRGTVRVSMLNEILKLVMAHCTSIVRLRNGDSCVGETTKCFPADPQTSLGL